LSIAAATSSNVMVQPPPLRAPSRRYSTFQVAHPRRRRSAHTGRITILENVACQ